MLDLLRPSCCYWLLLLGVSASSPSQCWSACLGVTVDLLLGSTLGIRGMMSIVIYLIALNFCYSEYGTLATGDPDWFNVHVA